MVAMLVRPGAACLGFSIRSMLNLTAAASKGSPLWNFTFRRSLNCQVVSLTEPPGLGQVALELEGLEVSPEEGVEDLAVWLVGVLVAVHVPVERRRLAGLR